MRKKAQGFSLNVIVVAALALLILVVLSVVFMSRMGHWSKDTKDCVNAGGKCIDIGDDCPTGYHAARLSLYKCYTNGNVDPEKKCCIAGDAS